MGMGSEQDSDIEQEWLDKVAAVGAAFREAEAAYEQASEDRMTVTVDALEAGVPAPLLATVLGVHRVRIYQFRQQLAATKQPPKGNDQE